MAKHSDQSSRSSNLVPLAILFLVLCVAGAIGFIVYSIAQEVKNNTKKKMQKKNITMSRAGMKVGVKEVTTEEYGDKTQNMLVKIWSNSSFKGRFDSWGTPTGSASSTPVTTPGTEKRKPYFRSPSSQTNVKGS